METEIWKDVLGYGGHYQASSLGRVRVKDRVVTKFCGLHNKVVEQKYKGRLLNPNVDPDGHLKVHISVDGKKYGLFVHHAVLLAFFGERPEGLEACHNNGVAGDNRPENLRWDTHFNNNQDRKKHGTYQTCENHPMAKFNRELVIQIRKGLINLKDSGVSRTQFYRIKNNESWRGI